jgi:two-component system invasion response regulator UvrY
MSQREREIFVMLAEGRSIKRAAFDLGLSPKTVETCKCRLMRKLNIDNLVDLAKMAIRTRLVKP